MKRFADIQSKVPIVKLKSRPGAQTSLNEMEAMAGEANSGKVSNAMGASGGVSNLNAMAASGGINNMQSSGPINKSAAPMRATGASALNVQEIQKELPRM